MESMWSPASWLGWENADPDPRQLRFERQRVVMLLKAFGLEHHKNEMVSAYQAKWGEGRLTFETFYELWPNFPIMLEAHSFYATSPVNTRARLSRFMTVFRKSFIFKRYEYLRERYRDFSNPEIRDGHTKVPPEARGLPLGMIFSWDGVKGGLILHNSMPLTIGSKFIHEYFDEEYRPIRLVIERFTPWVAALSKSGWSPSSPAPTPRPLARPVTQRGVVLRPWLVRLCGPRDAIVLSWLLRVSGPGASRYEKSYRCLRDEKLCVAVTARGLAWEVGLDDEQQVTRALRDLDGKGFIEKTQSSKGEKRKTYIWVNRQEIANAKRALEEAADEQG